MSSIMMFNRFYIQQILLIIVLLFFGVVRSFGIITEGQQMTTEFFKPTKTDSSMVETWAAASINAAETAYEMSMPLLANPTLFTEKEAKRFELLLAQTRSEEYKKDPNKQWMTSDEFHLWMQGRELLIAIKSNIPTKALAIAKNMQTALKPELYNPQVDTYNPNTAFACWALGYLTSYYAFLQKKEAYEQSKNALQKSIAYQLKYYGKPKGASLSDVMWSYAMAIQASAWAGDKTSYQHYMQGLAKLSGENSTPAISIKLLPNDQFPAWLASIVYSAALLMSDSHASAIRLALEEARQRSTKEQDKMLSISAGVDYKVLITAKNQCIATEQEHLVISKL